MGRGFEIVEAVNGVRSLTLMSDTNHTFFPRWSSEYSSSDHLCFCYVVYVVVAVTVDLKFKVLIGDIAESEWVKVSAWQGVGWPESTRYENCSYSQRLFLILNLYDWYLAGRNPVQRWIGLTSRHPKWQELDFLHFLSFFVLSFSSWLAPFVANSP